MTSSWSVGVDQRGHRADAAGLARVVAPRRKVHGSITVSWPIVTPTSIVVLAGSTIVTPLAHVALVDAALGDRADAGRGRRGR